MFESKFIEITGYLIIAGIIIILLLWIFINKKHIRHLDKEKRKIQKSILKLLGKKNNKT